MSKIIERLQTGKTPSSLIKRGKFKLPKLKIPKATLSAEDTAQIDTYNAHFDKIEAQRAASGLQT